jgi:phosphatidate phosphatase APP1
VISDIDDTIKITQTPSPVGILTNTFCIPSPQPVSGMPELYTHINDLLREPPFFYLSASPYNLYPFLREFREAHYPPGTIILRDASWQNLGGLITSLSSGTQEYKVDRIRKIHSWFPERKFVCIGDSTQKDPETYGQIAREFPGFVGAIYIRRVRGIAEMNEWEKNSDERFQKAFKGLNRALWYVFDEPGELTERIGQVVK